MNLIWHLVLPNPTLHMMGQSYRLREHGHIYTTPANAPSHNMVCVQSVMSTISVPHLHLFHTTNDSTSPRKCISSTLVTC